MKTLPEFLAHAIALEEESAVRFDELADALEVHHNTTVVGLFRKMAHFSRLHLAEVQASATGLDLPRYAPWEFQWPDAESPEVVGSDTPHYKMTPHHALTLALESEKRGLAFYAEVAHTTPDPEVRTHAAHFAEEEAEHVRLLEDWLTRFPPPPSDWDDDPDPPTSGE